MENYICEISDYIFEPLNDARKEKFLEVIGKISGNKVCDLGCSYAGIYWALGYFERVEEIYFYEYYEVNINKLENYLDRLSPSFLEEYFSDTISFLKKEKLIAENKTYEEIAYELLEKIVEVDKVDFFEKLPENNFDMIFSIESIECVNDEKEFSTVLDNIYGSLVPGGKHYFIMLSYGEKNNITEELIKLKLEGNFVFNQSILNNIYNSKGFRDIQITKKLFPDLGNRGKYYYGECIKN